MKYKILLSILLTVLLINNLSAQTRKSSLLFNQVENEKKKGRLFESLKCFSISERKVISDESQLTIPESSILIAADKDLLDLYQKNTEALIFQVPANNGTEMKVHLVQSEINGTSDYQFGIIGEGGFKKRLVGDMGIHYRGYVEGDSNSLAALSVFSNGEVMGFFCNKNGNYVLGKMKDQSAYIFYNSRNISLPKQPTCYTNDLEHVKNAVDVKFESRPLAPSTLCNKVRVYWEVDYAFYYNRGFNVTSVQNYINGLFNQVALIYLNEGITIELSELNVWSVEDPYRTSTRDNALEDFRIRWNKLDDKFNGDIAMLVAGGPSNLGGVAYINILCNRPYAYGYSQIYGYYSNYPVFSPDVYLLAHEMGHNLGSYHTQWCGWNTGSGGSCGAIDNCYPVESVSGGCSTCSSTININALPAGWKGTIMSYCNLTNVGVDFVNGFGSLPQSVIRSRVSSSTCLISNNQWNGSVDSLWSNASNWSCGAVPNATTDVTIKTPVTYFPVIKSTAICRKLNELQGATIKVNRGFGLTVAGTNNSVAVKIPATSKLFITGTATPGGLMQSGASDLTSQQMIRVTPTLYEIPSIRLTADESFLFVPVYGSFTEVYGFTGTALNNNTNGDVFRLNGNNMKAPAVTGNYHILVDFQTGRYTIYGALNKVTPPTSNEIFITGSATPAGWMSNGQAPVLSQKFTKLSNSEYELSSITLNGGGSFLFVPVYGNWNSKYGGIGYTNNSNNPLGDMLCSQGSDLLAPPTSGNYRIRINFHTGKYTMTKL
ncbi:MAG: hypothetical protein FGM46_00050 [Ferruginibacter sp.]|nr:hypothetical protein [Ferruginibacter sp.]